MAGVRGFDALLDHLVEEVAFHSELGATIDDFKQALAKFYLSTTVPENQAVGTVDDHGTSEIDRRLQERVWSWLLRHPDIDIAYDGSPSEISSAQRSSASLALPEAETIDHSLRSRIRTSENDKPDEQPSNASTQVTSAPTEDLLRQLPGDGTKTPAAPSPNTGLRLLASEECIWKAITGHGIDHKRIPRSDFQVLAAIAAHGEAGILQPDLVRYTGQDKRSLPRRTDRLYEHGYIDKTRVLAATNRTSLCVLKRWVKQASQSERDENVGSPEKQIFVNGSMHYDRLLDFVFDSLKESKVLWLEDLKRNMGITGNRWANRAVMRCVHRLALTGVIKRVLAKQDELAEIGNEKWLRCIRLERDPTEEDRKFFHAMAAKPGGKTAAVDEGIADDDASEMEYEELEDQHENWLARKLGLSRPPLLWNPDIPLGNLLFNFVQFAGMNGTNSKDMQKQCLGSFYQRPLHDFLTSLTETWYRSQPPHLRHLAIVRDASLLHRASYFIYRTYNNFAQAVEAGQSTWGPVTQGVTTSNSCTEEKNRGKLAPEEEAPGMDEWGFPRLSPNMFVGGSGAATLKDCETALSANACADDGNGRRGPRPPFLGTRKPGRPKKIPGGELLQETESTNRKRKTLSKASIESPSKKRQKKNHGRNVLGKKRSATDAGFDSDQCSHPSHQRDGPQPRSASSTHLASPAAQTQAAPADENEHALSPQSQQATCHSQSYRPSEQSNGRKSRAQRTPRRLANGTKANGAPKNQRGRPKKIVKLFGSGHPVSQVPTSAFLDSAEGVDRPNSRIGRIQPARTRRKSKKALEADESDLAVHMQGGQIEVDEHNLAGSAHDDPLEAERDSSVVLLQDDPLRPGVYIDPPGSEVPREKGKPGRPKRSMIAVFRSKRLIELNLGPAQNAGQQSEHESVQNGQKDQCNFLSSASNDVVPFQEASSSSSTTSQLVAKHAGPAFTESNENTRDAQIQQFNTGRDNVLCITQPQNEGQITKVHNLRNGEPPSVVDVSAAINNVTQASTPKTTRRRQRATTKAHNHSVVTRAASDEENEAPPITARRSSAVQYESPYARLQDSSSALATSQRQSEAPASPGRQGITPRQYSRVAKSTKFRGGWKTSSLRDSTGPQSSSDYLENVVDSNPGTGRPEGEQTTEERNVVQDSSLASTEAGANEGGMVVDVSQSPPITRDELSTQTSLDTSGLDHSLPQNHAAAETVPLESKNPEIPTVQPSSKRQTGKPSVINAPGSLSRIRTQIIMDIIDTCGGLYPGYNEIYQPFLARFVARNHDVNQEGRPDRHTVNKSAKNLIDAGKLSKLTFNFKDRNGVVVTRWIYARSEISPTSQKVRDMEKSIIEAHPSQYFPPEVRKDVRLTRRDPYTYEKDDETLVSTQYKPLYMSRLEKRIADTDARVRQQREKQQPGQSGLINRLGYAGPKRLNRLYERDHLSANLGGTVKGDRGRRLDGLITEGWPSPEYARFPRIGSRRSGPYGIRRSRINKEPYYDPRVEYGHVAAIVRPAQQFYPTSGTFSTDFLPAFGAKADSWILDIIQERFEQEMPVSLQDLISKVLQPRSRKFAEACDNQELGTVHELTLTQSWESRMGGWMLELRLRQPRFINHSIPGDLPSASFHGHASVRWPSGPTNSIPEEDDSSSDDESELRAPLVQARSDELTPPGFTQRFQEYANGLERPPLPRTHLPPAVEDVRKSTGTADSTRDHIAAATASRLIMAVTAVRVLTGGESTFINWKLVRKAFNRYNEAYLRQGWRQIRRACSSQLSHLSALFQEAFLAAYERGELPEINYGNLMAYDWKTVVEWAQKNVKIDKPAMIELPASRNDFDRSYSLGPLSLMSPQKESLYKEAILRSTRVTYMNQYPLNVPFTWPASSPSEQPSSTRRENCGIDLVASWVRANIATPAEQYNTEEAKAKLGHISMDAVNTALRQLIDQKTVHQQSKGRPRLGRNYAMSDLVASAFKSIFRLQPSPKNFREAAAFKQELDAAFRLDIDTASAESDRSSPQPRCVEFKQNGPDGAAMAITNLLARGRVKLIPRLPPIDHTVFKPTPRISKWGLNEGSYRTIHMDREKLFWPLIVVPTDTYIPGNPLAPSAQVEDHSTGSLPVPPGKPGPGNDGQAIPIWYTIHGRLLPDWWRRVVAAVLGFVALRPGVPAEEMASALKGRVWAWELSLALGWLEEVGAAEKVDHRGGGYTVAEWWWLGLEAAEMAEG